MRQAMVFVGVATVILGLIVALHPSGSLNVIAVLFGVLLARHLNLTVALVGRPGACGAWLRWRQGFLRVGERRGQVGTN